MGHYSRYEASEDTENFDWDVGGEKAKRRHLGRQIKVQVVVLYLEPTAASNKCPGGYQTPTKNWKCEYCSRYSASYRVPGKAQRCDCD
jgi:hypothetical protein